MSYIEKEKLIKADIASIENRVRHAFNQGYDLGYKEGKERAKPQEPQTFKWCTDCKEYDQEKHCCHRWSKVIRDTVEEMKQEPFINKPCISSEVCEHDKQKVLEKIRAEIRANSIYVMPQYGRTIREADVLHIIDKYKAEIEPQESEG